MKHTPTPWDLSCHTYDGQQLIDIDTKTTTIAVITEGEESWLEDRANAAHIVKCVNLHDELVDILSDSLSSFSLTQNPNHYPNDSWCRRAMSVLAKARGEA